MRVVILALKNVWLRIHINRTTDLLVGKTEHVLLSQLCILLSSADSLALHSVPDLHTAAGGVLGKPKLRV